jgi:nucleoid DNA-binding protein
MAMTKIDIAKALKETLGYPKNQARGVTEKLWRSSKSPSNPVRDSFISGFGKFEVKEKSQP